MHLSFLSDRDAFAKLLSSGDLSEKYSTQLKTIDSDFGPILAKICFFGHFSSKYILSFFQLNPFNSLHETLHLYLYGNQI